MIASQSIMDDGLSQEGKDRLNSGGNYLEATHDLWLSLIHIIFIDFGLERQPQGSPRNPCKTQ